MYNHDSFCKAGAIGIFAEDINFKQAAIDIETGYFPSKVNESAEKCFVFGKRNVILESGYTRVTVPG